MNWDIVIRISFIVILAAFLCALLRFALPVVVGRATKRVNGGDYNQRVETISNIFINTSIVAVGMIAILTILSVVGIDVWPSLMGLGVLGLLIAFGAQNVMKDIFNGILIILENQYNIGDVVDLVGIQGKVKQVDLRKTIIEDSKGILHIIPNGKIEIVSNYSKVTGNSPWGYFL